MRNGFLKSIAGLLASAGLALAAAPGPVVQVSFEDAEKIAMPNGSEVSKVQPLPPGTKVVSSEPVMMDGPAVWDNGAVGGPSNRFWAGADYLLWWIKDSKLPPLVTTGPAASGGALGYPGTSILFGGTHDYDHEDFSGGRFTAGMWLDCERTVGLEGSYFFLGGHNNFFNAGSSGAVGSAVLARPFYDLSSGGASNSELAAFPGWGFLGPQVGGSIHVALNSSLQGAEANGVLNLACSPCFRFDLLGGFRYLELREDVDILEHVNVLPTADTAAFGPVFTPGNQIDLFDGFGTRNHFYGGQIGGRAEWVRGRIFVDVLGKVALGDTDEELDINGNTLVTTAAGARTRTPGGLLALSDNIGSYSRNRFAVVPEAGVNVGYQINCHLRAYVGYTFLYWSDVARPGDQINLGLNSNRAPTSGTYNPAATPARVVAIRDTDFWAQGINFGLEFCF
jgi:hypothetical protein